MFLYNILDIKKLEDVIITGKLKVASKQTKTNNVILQQTKREVRNISYTFSQKRVQVFYLHVKNTCKIYTSSFFQLLYSANAMETVNPEVTATIETPQKFKFFRNIKLRGSRETTTLTVNFTIRFKSKNVYFRNFEEELKTALTEREDSGSSIKIIPGSISVTTGE